MTIDAMRLSAYHRALADQLRLDYEKHDKRDPRIAQYIARLSIDLANVFANQDVCFNRKGWFDRLNGTHLERKNEAS
jgi:hypothetical protein